MPQNIVDADTWTATVQVAADGDAVDGASQVLIGQDLADRTRYLYNRNIAAVGGLLGVALINATPSTSARWIPVDGFNWQMTSVASAGLLALHLPQVLGAKLTEVHCMVHGDLEGNGPHGALPATMPQIELDRIDYLGAGVTNIGTTVDSSANVAAYETHHLISITGLSEAFDEEKQWALKVKGETGANSLVDTLAFYGCYIKIEAV
jgi:hypothetical protein